MFVRRWHDSDDLAQVDCALITSILDLQDLHFYTEGCEVEEIDIAVELEIFAQLLFNPPLVIVGHSGAQNYGWKTRRLLS